MKKLYLALALVCLLLMVAGYQVVFLLQLGHAKVAMKMALKNSDHPDIVVLELSTAAFASLHWTEPGEFRYQGAMYDVIGKENTCGHWIIRCISDEKETLLLEHFRKTQRQTRDIDSLLKLIASAYLPPPFLSSHSFWVVKRLDRPDLDFRTASRPSPVELPPPDPLG